VPNTEIKAMYKNYLNISVYPAILDANNDILYLLDLSRNNEVIG